MYVLSGKSRSDGTCLTATITSASDKSSLIMAPAYKLKLVIFSQETVADGCLTKRHGHCKKNVLQPPATMMTRRGKFNYYRSD